MITYLKQCALFYLLNGIAMIIVPELWYQHTPGAADTGPFNAHFVRDIGIAFFFSSAGLWYAFSPRTTPNLPLAWLALSFLLGHSFLHLLEMFTMAMPVQAIARDFVLIVIPVLVALIGLMRLSNPRETGQPEHRAHS